jgi:hypothetical protein
MTPFKILCPSCASVLSSNKPVPNGRTVTCPKCKKPFVAATSVAASTSMDSAPRFDFEAPDAPAAPTTPASQERRSIIAARPRAPSHRLALWCILGGVALLGGGAGFGYYFGRTPEIPAAVQAKNPEGAKPAPVKGSGAERPKEPKLRRANDARKELETSVQPAAANVGAKPAGVKAAALPAPSAPAAKPAKRPQWQEHKSSAGGFVVMFPGKPQELREREADVIHYTAKAELDGIDYEITFHRLKKDELAMPVKDRLGAIADGFKDLVRSKKEIELQQQPALELELLLGDKKILAVQRWLVYKEHVFHISVSGDKERLGPDQVTRFLDSYRFVADPQGEFVDLTKTSDIPQEKKPK